MRNFQKVTYWGTLVPLKIFLTQKIVKKFYFWNLNLGSKSKDVTLTRSNMPKVSITKRRGWFPSRNSILFSVITMILPCAHIWFKQSTRKGEMTLTNLMKSLIWIFCTFRTFRRDLRIFQIFCSVNKYCLTFGNLCIAFYMQTTSNPMRINVRIFHNSSRKWSKKLVFATSHFPLVYMF